MDLLQEYYEEKENKRKIVLSTFFEEKNDVVTRFCNNFKPEERNFNLQEIWEKEVELFSNCNPNVKIIKDYYLVDFVKLNLGRKISLDNNKLRQNVVDTRCTFVNELIEKTNEDMFNTTDDLIPITNILTLNKLDNAKNKLKHVDDIHKQDLLYNAIIDFTTSKENHSVFKVFNKEEIIKYKKQFESRVDKDANIFKKTNFILQDVEENGIKATLKQKKKYARSQTNAKLLKKVIKALKVYRDVVAGEENKLVGGLMNETEYTFDFIRPLIKQVLYDCGVKDKLGEPYLDCAPRESTDDDRTAVGPKIDMIFFSKAFSIPISVCEVTGPFNKSNKNHFLGDRNKIAKNLKYIIRNIKKNTATPDINTFKKLKVYGFQFYLNNLYIYSLQKISKKYYIFLLEKKLAIPTSNVLLQQQLPSFFANLWSINAIFKDMDSKMRIFFEASNKEYLLAESDSETSTPTISPKKKSRLS